MLPEADAKGAALVAERCRKAIKQLAIPHFHSSISDRLTVSLGVCTLVPTAGDGIQRFINREEGLLYIAKKTGRNPSAFEK